MKQNYISLQDNKHSLIIDSYFDSSTKSINYLHPNSFMYEYKNNKEIVHHTPVSVYDVAAYILDKLGQITTMKLQKLVYYCQAWSLVWDEASLFSEPIEAWVNGPVVRDLYTFHRGLFQISSISIGVKDNLSALQKETIDAVLDYYGKKTGQQLAEISHLEDPWIRARNGLDRDEQGARVISNESMMEYYTYIANS